MEIGNIPKTNTKKENLPDLLLGDEYSLVRLQYQKDENQYLTTKTLKLSPDTGRLISHLLQCQKTIFILTSNLHNHHCHPLDNEGKVQIKVLKLTSDLEISSERIFEEQFKHQQEVGVTTYRDNLIISVNNSLLVLDCDLMTLGEVNLNIGKNADHILVYENIAYLLDDILAPLFILKADLSYPEQPKILQKYQVDRVNAHLTGQWIEPNLNRWYVIEHYSSMGGSGTNLWVFPLQGKISQLGCQSICEITWWNDIYKSGQAIIAVTSLPPIWSITKNLTNGKLYLTLIKHRNKLTFSNFIEFENHVDLGSLLPQEAPFDQNDEDNCWPHNYWRHSGVIKTTENYLFTVFSSIYRQQHEDSFDDLRLVVFQTKPDLRIILNQKLDLNFQNPKLEILS